MKKMSKRIVFFGNERLATGVTTDAPVLRALIVAGYEIAALVIAQNDAGASRNSRKLEIVELAEEYKIPVLSPAKPSDIRDQLLNYGAEAAVLVAYGKILASAVLDIFPRGIINLHPSLLPKHRGSTPIESAILAGEAETGVSIMQLSAKMDAGDVFLQDKLALVGDESKQELADQLSTLGAEALISVLPGILDGTTAGTPQDEQLATYDQQLAKADALLDFTKPARQLEREVRAFLGWPRSRTTLGSVEVIITHSRSAEGQGQPGSLWLQNNELGICTSDGIFLIDSLVPAGKKEMTSQAFLAGYKLT